MNQADYEVFDRLVEDKIRYANGAWFSVGWDPMVKVCEDKVAAGTLERRYNVDKNCLDFRAL